MRANRNSFIGKLTLRNFCTFVIAHLFALRQMWYLIKSRDKIAYAIANVANETNRVNKRHFEVKKFHSNY